MHGGHSAQLLPIAQLVAGAKAGLRPLHDALLGQIRALGTFDIAPKKGYLSLRRRKQFAMVQPSTTSRIDLGLILPATTPATGRLEPAAKFNPLFTHRVRITAATDLDDELRGWLATAYALARIATRRRGLPPGLVADLGFTTGALRS